MMSTMPDDGVMEEDFPMRCEKCGRPVTKHVGPLSTVVQHEDTGRVSCRASGLTQESTPIPHQLRCPACRSTDVACERSNRNRTHTPRCHACGREDVYGLANA